VEAADAAHGRRVVGGVPPPWRRLQHAEVHQPGRADRVPPACWGLGARLLGDRWMFVAPTSRKSAWAGVRLVQW